MPCKIPATKFIKVNRITHNNYQLAGTFKISPLIEIKALIKKRLLNRNTIIDYKIYLNYFHLK
jgi:hypothetical protein